MHKTRVLVPHFSHLFLGLFFSSYKTLAVDSCWSLRFWCFGAGWLRSQWRGVFFSFCLFECAESLQHEHVRELWWLSGCRHWFERRKLFIKCFVMFELRPGQAVGSPSCFVCMRWKLLHLLYIHRPTKLQRRRMSHWFKQMPLWTIKLSHFPSCLCLFLLKVANFVMHSSQRWINNGMYQVFLRLGPSSKLLFCSVCVGICWKSQTLLCISSI